MERGEVRAVTHGACEDVYLLETGMFDVTGYGGVYLLGGEHPAIVETGTGQHRDVVLDALRELEIAPGSVETIAVTHVHLDHAGGAGHLAEACPDADVIVHERGAAHLADPERLVAGTKAAVGDQWTYYAMPEPIPSDRIIPVTDRDHLDVAGRRWEVHAAPGHAPHQVMYHDPAIEAVFTGDGAGIWVPEHEEVTESTPPPDFDLVQAIADLDRLTDCDPQTLLFTHFGPAPFDPGFPERYAEVLQTWVDDVATVRDRLADDEAVVEHFTTDPPYVDAWSAERARAETRLNVRGVLAYLNEDAGPSD